MTGREKFEDDFGAEWRDAFDDFSQEPPQAVWDNIDKQLTYKKMLYYKRSTRAFQYLTAAVLLLAAFLMLNQYFRGNRFDEEINLLVDNGSSGEMIGQADEYNNDQFFLPEDCENLDYCDDTMFNNTQTGQTYLASAENSKELMNYGITSIDSKLPGGVNEKNDPAAVKSKVDAQSNDDMPTFTNGEKAFIADEIKEQVDFDKLYSPNPILPSYESTIASSHGSVEMWNVADYSYMNQKNALKKRSKSTGRIWAGVDFGSSAFDPNYQSSDNTTLENSVATSFSQFSGARTDAVESQAPSVEESMSAGSSFSFGMNVGMNLSDKWTLTSGLVYNVSEATNTTNVVVRSTKVQEAIPATQELKNVGQVNRIVSSDQIVEYDFQDVDFANEFQFASLPIRAGYKILDNVVSVEINAGIAANLYLGNKLAVPNDGITDITIGPGSESSYREVSFSGLAGIQFGYLFARRFEFVLQPNYQQSLNSLTKESAEFESNPSGFGVSTGLRFRLNE